MKFVNFSNETLIAVGAGVLAALAFLFKWFINKSLDKQFDKMNRVSQERQKEQEYDNYLTLRGQQVNGDCLHELIYAVLNGTHNGGLEKANKELDEYRDLIDKNIADKAARHNWTLQNGRK